MQRVQRWGGMPNVGRFMMAWTSALALLPATAAPQDELLTALPERMAPTAWLDLGSHHLNGSLAFFRKRDDATPGTRQVSGDYRGAHLAGGVRLADGLWLSGSLRQHDIRSDADAYRLRTWQLAGQYRFLDGNGARPALALRLSGWGNRAKATATTTPVRVEGAILDTVTIEKPSDRQLQADLIATWVVTPALDFGVSFGAGRTRLAYQGLKATTTLNGCRYDLEFNGNDIFGNLAAPCTSSAAVIRQFYDSSGDYGIDVANEIAWSGRFVQGGVHLDWHSGAWTLRGGLLLHSVRRKAVDDIIAARGDPVYRRNRIASLEADYRFQGPLSIFVRAQLNSHLFVGEIPVTYNTSTSDSFANRYSLFTLGLRASF